jgi:hypothetical protein
VGKLFSIFESTRNRWYGTEVKHEHISHKLFVNGLTTENDEFVLHLGRGVPFASVWTFILQNDKINEGEKEKRRALWIAEAG